MTVVMLPQMTTKETYKCPLADVLLSEVEFATDEEVVNGCCDKQLAISAAVTF